MRGDTGILRGGGIKWGVLNEIMALTVLSLVAKFVASVWQNPIRTLRMPLPFQAPVKAKPLISTHLNV